MKKSILVLVAAVSMSMGAATVAHADESTTKSDNVLTFQIDGATPMNATEIADTRGEAVLKSGLKCKWKVICKPYIYIAYESGTYWKNGQKHTYTRSH